MNKHSNLQFSVYYIKHTGISIALIFITVGIGFKLSHAPSHKWTPKVYMGPNLIHCFFQNLYLYHNTDTYLVEYGIAYGFCRRLKGKTLVPA